MRFTLRLSLFAAVAATAVPVFAQQKLTPFEQSYRSTYIASCTREFAGAPEAGPAVGAKICSCVATTLVGNLDDKQLQNLDARLAEQGTKSDAFAAIQEITSECAKPEVQGNVDKNAEHLREIVNKHPDLSK